MMKYTATLKLKCDHPSGYRLHIAGRIGVTFNGVGKGPTQGKDLTQAKLLDFARKNDWGLHRNGTHSCPDCVKEKRGIPRHPASPNKPTPVAPPIPHDWSDAPINAMHWNRETGHYYCETHQGDVLAHDGHAWSPSAVTSLDLADAVFTKRPGATESHGSP